MTTSAFVGLGVMGEPMCRNFLDRCGHAVMGFDLHSAPLDRLAAHGLRRATSVSEIGVAADQIFLSLPGGAELEAVCRGSGGLLTSVRAGSLVVDTSSSPVDLTRELAAAFAAVGVDYLDAPVARTRAAAANGTLSIMVGATPGQFARAEPLLAHMGEVVTHCGGAGAGQVVKLMNNMVLFQTVVALAEAKAVGASAGVDPEVLFTTLANGSADSFALRNHGMKAMLPGTFPEDAFGTDYAAKDLRYALALAAQAGISLPGAEVAARRLAANSQAGRGKAYFPSLGKLYE